MSTQRGTPCPDCDGAEKTQYLALVAKDGQRYSVGPNCYCKQWAVQNEGEPCPIKIPEVKSSKGK